MVLKVFGVVVQFLLSNPVFFGFLGLLNRLSGRRLFSSVFLAYPANERIVRRFSFEWAQPFFRLRPATLGFFLVQRRFTLVLSLGAVEKDIYSFSRAELELLDRRLEKIQNIIGASSRTMAGILPSVMAKHTLVGGTTSRASTVRIVSDVVRGLIETEQLKADAPIVVVGARGYIGAGLCEALATHHTVVGLEKEDNVQARLAAIDGRHLVVNVASYKAWYSILDGLTSEAVVLNEVYPPPHGKVKKALQSGWPVYHVSGVRTRLSFPSLGDGYDNVMPCCAASGDPATWEAVVVRLNA
jgi:hypothetical protein